MKTFTKSNGFNRSLLLLLICALMMTNKTQAQYSEPLPLATSCTSKDLELASASLVDASNNLCNSNSGYRKVVLGINNKTGSTRTAFAAWATLRRYNAKYTSFKDTLVFFCAGPIDPNSFKTYPTGDSVYYQSGENLVLRNIFLAWTTANQKEDCNFLKANPSKIAPKCGTQDSIQLYAGVSAEITSTAASCPSGKGTLSVTPSGGKIPYAVKVALVVNGTDTIYKTALQGQTVVFDVNPGNYNVIVTDANNCTKEFSNNKIDPPPSLGPLSATPVAPTCEVKPGVVDIKDYNASNTYKLTGSPNSYTNSGNSFTGVKPGSYTLSASYGACNDTNKIAAVVVADTIAVPIKPNRSIENPTCTFKYGKVNIIVPVPAPANYDSYSFKLIKGTDTATAKVTLFDSVAPKNTYRLIAKLGACITAGDSVTIADTLEVPVAPKICTDVDLDLCNIKLSTITVNIDTSAINRTNYAFSNNGTTFSNQTSFSLNLENTSPTQYYIKSLTSGCVSSATNGCEATACSTPVAASASSEVTGSAVAKPVAAVENSRINNLGAGEIEAAVTVKPIPNPFKNQVRFLINTPTSGNGSLDIFNIQGQKIKTLYQGYIPAGANFFDLTVPVQRQGDLIYIFTQGNTRLSGKLIQINGNNRN